MPIKQSSCPVCDSDRRNNLPVVNHWMDITWSHVRCKDCGHRYNDPIPTDSEITRMYDRSYFEDGGGWVCGFWGGSYESNEKHLRTEALDALSAIPLRSGCMLEIGCAGGFFLEEARRAGFDVTGVELNHEMVEHAREKLGLTVLEGLFENVGFEPESFDVIVSQDVLEHVRDPHAFVGNVAKLLKPNGWLFVRGPLEESVRHEIYMAVRTARRRGVLVVNEPPFHLQGFCRKSFTRVLTRGGLEPVAFTSAATVPSWKFTDPRHAVATMIELAAFYIDRLRGSGDFMTATARKPSA